jgi:hypothetical protein
LEQGLTFARQDFQAYRQSLLTKANEKKPDYTAEQLHKHMTVLATHLLTLQGNLLPLVPKAVVTPLLVYNFWTNQSIITYFTKLTELADAQVRLGLIYLEEGDIPTAKFHFQEANKLPELPIVPSSLKLAREYLKAIP